MKKRKFLAAALIMLAVFVIWTIAVARIDVQPIGPMESQVGFAALNGFFHGWTGVCWPLYILTDWLSLVPACAGLAFAMLGLVQWISRRSLRKVDRSLLALGGFYVLVGVAYLFFEQYPINFRPVLIDGMLEASYPSSTTLLVLTLMPTAALQLRTRLKNPSLQRAATIVMGVFTALMVIARLLSGVHWLTDIIGGMLLSTSLVLLYQTIA